MKKIYITKKCDLCGKEFTPTSPPQKYCSKECYDVMQHKFNMDRKQELRQMKKANVVQVKEDPSQFVHNACPKDCRFMEKISGFTYCNYGEIAFNEGLIDKPARNIDPDNATYNCGGKLYEPRAKNRRIGLILGHKSMVDNEVDNYKRERITQYISNEHRRGNI